MSKREIDWDKFNTLYLRFQNKYLGYSPRHGYFFQFKFVDKLFNKWLNDNDKIYDPARDNEIRGVTVAQRVLECLGMNRLITFEQLWERIEEQRHIFEQRILEEDHSIGFLEKSSDRINSKEEIKLALEYYTLSQNYSKPHRSSRPDIEYEFDQRIKEYIDLMQHLLLVCKDDESGNVRYELSLFGLAILLSLTAHHYLNPEMLFYNNLNFEKYYKKLSLNYRDKLPRIFGKWDRLTKSKSAEESATESLIQLFYEKNRTARVESSVLVGGLKEYYGNIEVLTKHTYLNLEEIYNSCKSAVQDEERHHQPNHIKQLYRKMEEIENSLRLRDLQRFTKGLWDETKSDSLKKEPSSIYREELVNMETAFEEEITVLFYLSLDNRSTPVGEYDPLYSTYFPSTFQQVDGRTSPSGVLTELLRNDMDAKELLVHWINDSIECQKEAFDLMSSRQQKVE